MIVRTPRIALDRTHARLEARIESDGAAFEPTVVAITVPRAQAAWLDASGDAWVPIALQLAARLGERLLVEAPVSARLLDGARAVARRWEAWWGLQPPRIDAETATSSPPRGTETLACFTRGVDSWFSALRATAPGATVRPTRLVYVPDLDRQYGATRRARAVRRTAAAAATLGLPLLVVGFDGRRLIDRFVDWDDVFAGPLAGVALALGNAVERFLLPSSHDLQHLPPHGSHPDTDPAWSTERTAIVHDGADASRTTKVRAIAAVPSALAQLKVCWEVDTDGNCGRCRKCLRTMIALRVAGVVDVGGLFDAPFSVDAFTALPGPRADKRRTLFAELYDDMPDDPALRELRDAVRARLAPWHPAAPHRPPAPPGPPIVVESVPGAAVQLATPLARGILPGPLLGAETPRPAGARRLEVTWGTTRAAAVTMPWRPPASEREAVHAACRAPGVRPVRWCVLDHPSAPTAELLQAATAAWGPGLVCLPHRGAPDCDHGTPRALAAAMQRRAAIRAWRGDGTALDPFRTLEALRQGCLPLQCVGADEQEMLAAELPAGLMAFVVTLDAEALAAVDVAARLDRGASVVLAGSLERDLRRALARLAVAA